jgi:hypothetical protein
VYCGDEGGNIEEQCTMLSLKVDDLVVVNGQAEGEGRRVSVTHK